MFETSKLVKIKKEVGHYNTKNVYKRDKRVMASRANLDKCMKEIESLKAQVLSLEKKKSNALQLLSKWKLRGDDRRNSSNFIIF